MPQLADDRHLAVEAVDGRAGGRRLGHDQLERDHLPGLVVPGLVDHAHRAAAELAQGGVMRHRLGQGRRLGAASEHHHSTTSVASPWSGPAIVMFCGAGVPQPAHRMAVDHRHRIANPKTERVARLTARNRSLIDPDPEDALARRDHVARGQPNPVHSLIVHERPVRAPQVAQLALRRVDLDHEVIARERHVLRHRAMDEPRSADDERVVTVEHEGTTLAWALQHFQYHSHRFVPGLSYDERRIPRGSHP